MSVLTLLGEQMGEHVAGHGLVGAVALPAAGTAVHALRQAALSTVNDPQRLAMLHPNVARELLARVGPNRKVGPLAQRRLAAAIKAAIGTSAVRQTAGSAQ